MKKHIVITTINYPTEAVISFAKMNDYQLIVVGDKKTPVDYMSVIEQENMDFELSKEKCWNI